MSGILHTTMQNDPPTRIELNALAHMLSSLDERLGAHDAIVRQQVQEAVKEAFEGLKLTRLTEDEVRWIRTAMEYQGQRVLFRRAIITHSTTGLIWAAIAWLGIVFLEYLKNHGWK